MRTLKVPGFGRLAATYGLNELADWCASIALAALVYAATGDALATTALFIANRFLPAFVVPFVTARLEGLRTPRVLGAIYAFEAVTLGALALTASSFLLVIVIVLAFADGALAATARALTRAATVALMEPVGKLREGNATLNIVFSVSCAGGPVVGGAVVALAGEGPVLAVAAALFVLQALVIAGAHQLVPAGELDEGAWMARLRAGLAHVRDERPLRAMLLTHTAVAVFGSAAVPVYIVYAHESLDVGDAGYGALLAAWGLGMVVGSMVFARFRDRGLWRLVALTTLVQGLAYVGLGSAPHITVACVCAAIGGIGNGIYWVSVVTAIQEATADAFQARVAGVLEGVNTAGPGLGFVLGGAIAAVFDPRVTLALAGAGIVVVAVWLLLARAAVPAPAPAPVETA